MLHQPQAKHAGGAVGGCPGKTSVITTEADGTNLSSSYEAIDEEASTFVRVGKNVAMAEKCPRQHGDLNQFQRQPLAVLAELTKLAQTGIARSAAEPPNVLHTCEQQINFGLHRACISSSQVLAFRQLEVTSIKLQLIQVF